MTHRNGEESDKRGVGVAGAGSHIALNVVTVDRIGTIEHDDPFAVPSGGTHELRGRCDVGVVASADVLEIDEQDIDRVECRLRRATRSAIETVDCKPGHGTPA